MSSGSGVWWAVRRPGNDEIRGGGAPSNTKTFTSHAHAHDRRCRSIICRFLCRPISIFLRRERYFCSHTKTLECGCVGFDTHSSYYGCNNGGRQAHYERQVRSVGGTKNNKALSGISPHDGHRLPSGLDTQRGMSRDHTRLPNARTPR